MNRKDTTAFLSDLLERDRLSGIGKYYASEVVLDWGTNHERRVDFLQYIPKGAVYVGDIENGTFVAYEIKSCREDVYSGNGLNFIAEENYIVTTVGCYKKLLPDMRSGKLENHVKEMNDGRITYFDFLLAVPDKSGSERFNPLKAMMDEAENPTPLDAYGCWRLAKVGLPQRNSRRRPTVELLFCMLRSGK